MNGRLYDPLVGRILNADPFIQDAGHTQSYNRYSYCLNNPLKFTDPSGYINQNPLPRQEPKDDRNRGGSSSSWMEMFGEPGYYGWAGSFGNDGGGYGGRESYTPHIDRGRALSQKQDPLRFSKKVSALIFSGTRKNPYEKLLGFHYNDGSSFYYNDVAAGEGGDYGWAKNTQTAIGAFDIGNGIKSGMIDYAVASSAGKTMNSLQRADYVATLGKAGANYVKAFKVAGGVTFIASSAISIGLSANYYNNGGTGWSVGIKSGIDVGMGVIAFIGPIGFGISATYFIIDAASGGFGGYGDPLKY